jgi:hypothetical protein
VNILGKGIDRSHSSESVTTRGSDSSHGNMSVNCSKVFNKNHRRTSIVLTGGLSSAKEKKFWRDWRWIIPAMCNRGEASRKLDAR